MRLLVLKINTTRIIQPYITPVTSMNLKCFLSSRLSRQKSPTGSQLGRALFFTDSLTSIKLQRTLTAYPVSRFQMGNCYYKQLGPADRDQSYTDNAIAEYSALIRDYPNGEYSTAAGKLAEMGDSVVVPLFQRRLDDGTYVVDILPRIEVIPSGDLVQDSQSRCPKAPVGTERTPGSMRKLKAA